MNSKLQNKLKELPSSPGVYFHKDKTGEIIYVGKAASLRNRVRQYFQNSRVRDPKTDVLVSEIVDTDWITTESEIDALFLESEMVKRYMPRYNIMLRDDKSQIFVRINMNDPYPFISYTRQPMDDNAQYFGPYYNGQPVKRALKYLRRVFPYSVHTVLPKRVCLQYHLGLCPGVEESKISPAEYKKTLKKLIMYLKGERKKLVARLQKEMLAASKKQDFELAARRRNQINNLRELQKQIVFSDKEFIDLSKDQALSGLCDLMTLKKPPYRIEAYDISHMQGTNNVASMVVATNGVADKAQYRKFKMVLLGNNDFAHMEETMSRRFSGRHLDWPKPDLIIIDGGKGQLTAAANVLRSKNINIPIVGLAKRLEEIVVHETLSNVTINTANYPDAFVVKNDEFMVVRLPASSHIIKLLQRIRDEAHRFAVSYHTVLKRQKQTASDLDELPGIGPVTRKKLIRHFGSLRALKQAQMSEIEAVVGKARAAIIKTILPENPK